MEKQAREGISDFVNVDKFDYQRSSSIFHERFDNVSFLYNEDGIDLHYLQRILQGFKICPTALKSNKSNKGFVYAAVKLTQPA